MSHWVSRVSFRKMLISGWTFLTANAINDKGQIIGIGQINGGAHTTFLLTPKKEPKPAHFKPPHGVFPGPQ